MMDRCRVCNRTSEETKFYGPSQGHARRGICAKCECARVIATKRRNKPSAIGIIYFVQIRNDDAFVKIGYTKSLRDRLVGGFFTDNPYAIDVVATCSGCQWEELELHRHLSGSRIRGEWYMPTKEVLGTAVAVNGGTITAALVKFRRRDVA